MMQSSVYQLFYDHIELNIILWFLLFLLFLDALFLWQPYKEKVPKRKISASDASNAAVNPKRFNVKTKNKEQKTKNKEQICHHRIVATVLSRGLGTQNNRDFPSSFQLPASSFYHSAPCVSKSVVSVFIVKIFRICEYNVFSINGFYGKM